MSGSSKWCFVAGLLVVTAWIFSPVFTADFLRWDDGAYVTQNPLLVDYSLSGISKLFSTTEVNGSYNPLVLLHWMFEASVFGLNPKVFHSINLFWHCLTALLIFALLQKLTSSVTLSLFVASVFCFHPMNVEPVAWVTGRKDLLSGFFVVSTFLAYHEYATRRLIPYLYLTILLFTLALLAKATVVFVPVVLFLADVMLYRTLAWKVSLLQKLPLFLLGLGFGLLAIFGQHSGGAFVSEPSFIGKMIFGVNGLSLYVIKFFVPFGLSAFHPFPSTGSGYDVSLGFIGLGMLILALLLILSLIRKNRLGLFGLLFFIVWLIPVLQFKPFGISYAGERFAYLPYLGLALAVGSLLLNEMNRVSSKALNWLLMALVIAWFGFNGFIAHGYCKTWKSDLTVWTNVLKVYPENSMPYFKLANIELKQGSRAKAMTLLNRSIQLSPNFSDAYSNRGMLTLENGNYQLALNDFDKALELDTTYGLVWMNKGVALLNLQRYAEAIETLNRALLLETELSDKIHYNLGRVHEAQHKIELASENYGLAYHQDKENVEFLYRFAKTQAMLFELTEAENLAVNGLLLYPENVSLLILLSEIQASKGAFAEALKTVEKARKLGANVDSKYLDKLKTEANSTSTK